MTQIAHIVGRKEYTLPHVERGLKHLEAFGLFLTQTEKAYIGQFFSSFDFADQIGDRKLLPDSNEHILKFLVGETYSLDDAIPQNVQDTFYFARNIIRENGIEAEIAMYARNVFECRELRARAQTLEQYKRVSLAEALLYAEMLTLFFPKEKLNQGARDFIFIGSCFIRLIDDALDMREDYRDKKIVLKPTLRNRLRLRLAAARFALQAFTKYPNKRYAAKNALRIIFQKK